MLSSNVCALGSSVPSRSVVETSAPAVRPWRCRSYNDSSSAVQQIEHPHPEAFWEAPAPEPSASPATASDRLATEIDPLYLFACFLEWEAKEDPAAGWELISAAQSSNSETRAHARTLLSSSRHLGGLGTNAAPEIVFDERPVVAESDMKAPYDIEIVEDCASCGVTNTGFFCGFSPATLRALNELSHKSTLPAGAILFVEGQVPRGLFILCSGKVNLSTTSREGKVLILKTAGAGETVGLSAVISGVGYETTAETATPCQLNFVERNQFLEFMQQNSETGVHAAQCLSRDYQSASRDIHDLVLTRSSTGKLVRLLLSQSPLHETREEIRVHGLMTHEEMAQRIGASRETVTRLLSNLRKKQLIRVDGSTLVIRDRHALEALAV